MEQVVISPDGSDADQKREVDNRRNDSGVKDSARMYRSGGERVCWLDGYRIPIVSEVVSRIRAAGFKAWRTGNTVWILAGDAQAVSALEIDIDAITEAAQAEGGDTSTPVQSTTEPTTRKKDSARYRKEGE